MREEERALDAVAKGAPLEDAFGEAPAAHAAADDDPMRLLDAKLAEALTKVIRGEPARRLAVEAERLAMSYDILSGRQVLRLAFAEFEKDDIKSDHVAYSNFEHLAFEEWPEALHGVDIDHRVRRT